MNQKFQTGTKKMRTQLGARVSQFLFGFLVLCLTGASSMADAPGNTIPDRPPGFQNRDVENFLEDMSSLSGTTALAGSESCVNAYQKIYKHDDTLNIRIFLGYLIQEADPGVPASDWVLDPYMEWHLISLLTRPCTGSLSACGFTQSADDAEVLTKEIVGPDQKPRLAKITLEVSAESNSDQKNRHELKAAQKARSKKIAKDFNDSLNGGADVVIYNGHARHATGPGFKPLPSLSLAWFDAGIFKPALHQMIQAMKKSKDGPGLIGYFACQVDEYYGSKFEKTDPETGIAMSITERTHGEPPSIPSIGDNEDSVLGTLNSVLGMRCEDDFKKSLSMGDIRDFF
jgi:hypothetical protein